MSRRKKKYGGLNSLRDLNFTPPRVEISPQTKRGIIIVVLLTLGALSSLSLFNLAGIFGVYCNNVLGILFGINRWYMPVVLLLSGYFMLRPAKYQVTTATTLGIIIFILSFNGLFHLLSHQYDLFEAAKIGQGGGLVGLILSWPLLKFFGFWATILVTLAFSLIGMFLIFDYAFFQNIAERFGSLTSFFSHYKNQRDENKIKKIQAERSQVTIDSGDDEDEAVTSRPEFLKRQVANEEVEVEQEGTEKKPAIKVTEEEKEAKQFDSSVDKFKFTKIDLPLSLLDGKTTMPKGGDIKANKLIIQKTLDNFGIPSEMGEAQVGPTVTQYTLKPAEGIKLSRITALSDNLALALAAHPIRIEAPIPGRSLIGIEVPNQATAVVPLGDILGSPEFNQRKSNLAIALGKDVMGKPWLYELDRMPHLLIAGATNSGKSVCINAIILSLLYQNGPGNLKFIMVDPKRVELPVYNGIPHLLTPVITDVKKTVNALRWAITEMEKRFDILAEARHRNIGSYNADRIDKMPYIVIVIDELADLMALAGAEVEAAIVRLAQMSRAVGIHLILATQRPSVDVITGLIKANITCRIAFSVASLVDSRTILDMSGAEKLLGRGDMLYLSAEISKPKRLQGAYASDNEIKRVIDYLKDQAEPDYVEAVVEKPQSGFDISSDMSSSSDEGDPLLAEAKEVILQAKKASASLLQRRLRVGYARAARILDLL
ncbi:MAG: DNA translocase FtsK 4TM domain-containing protein, partial [Candidatus Buchananbacteria bacterium]